MESEKTALFALDSSSNSSNKLVMGRWESEGKRVFEKTQSCELKTDEFQLSLFWCEKANWAGKEVVSWRPFSSKRFFSSFPISSLVATSHISGKRDTRAEKRVNPNSFYWLLIGFCSLGFNQFSCHMSF